MVKIIKKLKTFLIIAAAILIAVLLYIGKGLFIAATVNGQPVSRLAVVKELEKEGGRTVLDNLVTNSLILQEAKKEKITVSQTDINAQLTKITDSLKSSGQDLNTALAAQGMTKQDLLDQIKLQLLVQKMAGKDITVSDTEISDYYKQNQSSYPKNTKLEDVKDQIKSDLQSQKLNQSVSSWIANLKSKAKINYFVGY
jgi:foldase protein PrsA